jgi:hypothetical protein
MGVQSEMRTRADIMANLGEDGPLFREEFEYIGLEDFLTLESREDFIAQIKSLPSFPGSSPTENDIIRTDLNGVVYHPLADNCSTYGNINWLRQFTISRPSVALCTYYPGEKWRTTPLHADLATRDVEWLAYLLNSGVRLNTYTMNPCTTDEGQSPLRLALDWNINTARKLIDAGEVPRRDELWYVVKKTWNDIVELKKEIS